MLYDESPAECSPKGIGRSRRPTTRETLLEMKNSLEEKLNEINQALEGLDKNPEFEELHNRLTKVLR